MHLIATDHAKHMPGDIVITRSSSIVKFAQKICNPSASSSHVLLCYDKGIFVEATPGIPTTLFTYSNLRRTSASSRVVRWIRSIPISKSSELQDKLRTNIKYQLQKPWGLRSFLGSDYKYHSAPSFANLNSTICSSFVASIINQTLNAGLFGKPVAEILPSDFEVLGVGENSYWSCVGLKEIAKDSKYFYSQYWHDSIDDYAYAINDTAKEELLFNRLAQTVYKPLASLEDVINLVDSGSLTLREILLGPEFDFLSFINDIQVIFDFCETDMQSDHYSKQSLPQLPLIKYKALRERLSRFSRPFYNALIFANRYISEQGIEAYRALYFGDGHNIYITIIKHVNFSSIDSANKKYLELRTKYSQSDRECFEYLDLFLKSADEYRKCCKIYG